MQLVDGKVLKEAGAMISAGEAERILRTLHIHTPSNGRLACTKNRRKPSRNGSHPTENPPRS